MLLLFFALTILLKFIYIEKILMNFNISYIVFGDQYHCRRKKTISIYLTSI